MLHTRDLTFRNTWRLKLKEWVGTNGSCL
jgi:hypothetical protein